ncbi:branched-chain amino acid ABC transporter permease [Gordonia amarae]|uniref:Branched-chain amino acid ABC transporter permease n=2 Tax=Gordonia amarae TaxID=36821 RepID=A0A857KL59_9ACTN|nr:branched-chain amino acid ABC transporter permease [Gordonia amarae]MCS3879792.1 branched-chain amino acid transport system permease protein [Gordonia amarae]QHN18219.1 branched-chain amino acid ABC transporter permease [Gordonia amarae]QHN22703.1 branched-chain amino acid ABC transporter permease [Gordonia amarae]QHN31606.1 branched-chain amino acid ABC transporter permease [Gordonia amarae]QHN40350.1 branched-chain amino acid ABC transporter permease [Gordonia amarae]
MERFILFTVNGLAFGAVYASVAIALVIIFRSTRLVNFAQGAQAAVSGYLAYLVIDGTGSYWLGFVVALVSGIILGALVQQTVFRYAEKLPELSNVIVGVGLLVFIQGALGLFFPPKSGEQRVIPEAVDTKKWYIGDIPFVSPQDLFVLGGVCAMMLGLGFVLTKTPIGLRMRAAAFAPDTARLMGVKVNRMLTLGWAMAGFAGALAAMLVIPTSAELTPQVMDPIFVLGFAAAVIGGLDSLVGAVVGGLAAGLVSAYTTGYISADLTYVSALVLLMVILLVKPEGLFHATKARRV